MKIAVTGHAAGLGKAIAERLARDEHEIVGFSLENGFDFTTEDGFKKIVFGAVECDVFVNCAHDRDKHGMDQARLLASMFHHWQDQEKHIVSIGSEAPDRPTQGFHAGTSCYRAAKAALDVVATELNCKPGRCRVSTVRPGWIRSEIVEQLAKHTGRQIEDLLEYDEVADVVAMIIDNGPAITISSITLRRSTSASTKRAKWWRRFK